MRKVRLWLIAAATLVVSASLAAAQTTTGAISGRVLDSQGLALPGVTINAESPSLQGLQTTVTSENGDYLVPLLPPGTYKVTFQLSGFERQEKTVSVAPTQVLPLNVTLGPAAVAETVNVVGRAADVLTQTTQVANNYSQELISTLPTARDISSSLLMAPGVHPSGPSGNFTIAGAMSFDSLYMVNGVNVNENLRGTPLNLYIEDAIQETTIATDGVSAEYGRFSGGVVNVITKSGGNVFSGSFRDTLDNDNWRAFVVGNSAHPFPPPGSTVTADSKIDATVPQYEYVIGGPVAKDRLWFFNAGR
ncbi:MAG TPA: carboxypeptidase regulatory-like domain-containing protein, partial [Vicinamibacterales bacterium]|nr:carboxypeptidase regulatory-like domain-containing protein [Vicinamibacterales bacterium]